MQRLEVGGYFGKPQAIYEGCLLNYNAGGFTLLVALRDMDKAEAVKLKTGAINLALFEKEGILFLLVNVPEILDWSDAPFHMGLYGDKKGALVDIPEGKGLGLTIIGLEAKNSMIKSLRLVGLGTEFSRELIEIVQKQGETTRLEHDKKIMQIYREYTCDKMVKNAIAFCKIATGPKFR